MIYYDDRRAKSDILPVNSSTKSVCGMEESYEEKSFLSVKNKIIFALLPIVVIVCIFVCVLTVKQMNRELKDNLNTEISLTGQVVEGEISADAYPEIIPDGIYCGLTNGTYIDKAWVPDDPDWIMKERPWYIEGIKADEVTAAYYP